MPIRLKTIINSFTPDDTLRLTNWNERIDVARPFIFDFEYDLVNQSETVNTKEQFEQLFLKKYYNREIGQSGGTVTAFKQDLEVFLLENVDRYNELLRTLSWEYDPLINYKIEEERLKNVEDTSQDTETLSGSLNTTTDSTVDTTGNLTSDTTQDRLQNQEQTHSETQSQNREQNQTQSDDRLTNEVELQVPQGMVDVDDFNFNHASNAKQTHETNSSNLDDTTDTTTTTAGEDSADLTDTTTGNRTDLTTTNLEGNDTTQSLTDSTRNLQSEKSKDETETVLLSGVRGVSYQKLVSEYRGNIINVLKMMIDEADVLFYQLYDY